MPRPDEGMIHAWLDGELDVEESARIASLVERDPEWAAAAAEARGLIATSSRIVRALDVVPGDVIPSRTSAAGAKPRSTVRPWMRIAAGLALFVGVGYVARLNFADDAVPLAKVESTSDLATGTAVSVAPPASAPAPQASAEPAKAAPVRRARIAEADAAAEPRRGEVASGAGAIAPPVAPPAAPPAAPERVESTSVSAALKAIASDAREREKAPAGAVRLRAAVPAAPAVAGEAVAQLSPRIVVDRDGPAELGRSDLGARLDGCWRTRTVVRSDSVLIAPTIVGQVGDSLVIAIARPVSAPRLTANVVRLGADLLRGTARDRDGQAVAFTATRVSCP